MSTVRTLDGEDLQRADRVYATIFGVSLFIAVIGAFLVAWALHTRAIPNVQGKSMAAPTQQEQPLVSPP